MKKSTVVFKFLFFCFAFAFGTFFTGCSALEGDDFTQVEFDFDLSSLSASRGANDDFSGAAGAVNYTRYTLNFSIKGEWSDSKTFDLTEKDLDSFKRKVKFKNVPEGRTVYVTVELYDNGRVIKSASSKKIKVSRSTQKVSLVLSSDSQLVLYSKAYDMLQGQLYNYYLVDNPVLPLTSPKATLPVSFIDNTFSFDSNGDAYILGTIDVFLSDEATFVFTTNSERDKSPLQFGNLLNPNVVGLSNLTIDRKTNAMYVTDKKDDTEFNIYEFKDFIASGSNNASSYIIELDKISKAFDADLSSMQDKGIFCVYDGIVYIPFLYPDTESESVLLKFIRVKLSDIDEKTKIFEADVNDVIDVSSGKNKNIEKALFKSQSAAVTDCTYEDGALYVLVCDNKFIDGRGYFSSELYSRGALFKYNEKKSFGNAIGFTSGRLLNTDIKAMHKINANKADLGTVSKDEIVQSRELKDNVSVSARFPSVNAPSAGSFNLSSFEFYGPKKFIALKPQKLVIADEGCAFGYDDKDALAFKNVNRVVYVDLNDFAIESVSSTDATFDDDIQTLDGSDYLSLPNNGGSFYLSIAPLYLSIAPL